MKIEDFLRTSQDIQVKITFDLRLLQNFAQNSIFR